MEQFTHNENCSTALKVVQRNAFFAHPENALLDMLGNDHEKLEDCQLIKFKLCKENQCNNILFQMATLKKVTSRTIETQKVLLT